MYLHCYMVTMSVIGLNFIRMRENKSRTDFLIIQLLWNEKKSQLHVNLLKQI